MLWLYRKIEKDRYKHFTSKSDKILMLTGARQTGKSFIINHVASKIFRNVVEINLIEDYDSDRLFESVSSVDEFHLRLSSIARLIVCWITRITDLKMVWYLAMQEKCVRMAE